MHTTVTIIGARETRMNRDSGMLERMEQTEMKNDYLENRRVINYAVDISSGGQRRAAALSFRRRFSGTHTLPLTASP